jgi:hypothetical protein
MPAHWPETALPPDETNNLDDEWPSPDSDRPTVAPTALEDEKPTGKRPELTRLDSVPAYEPLRARQSTVTDEAELERAIAASAQSSPPESLSLDLDAPAGDALDLVSRSSSAPDPVAVATASPAPDAYDPVGEMHDRFSLGDYSGALVIAESLLEEDPNHEQAKRYAENCRSILEQMYAARLGSLEQVPFIAVPREQLRWLSLDHRAGFVLSHVDGISNLGEILDISGMPTLDALRILFELSQQRVISFR